MGHGTSQVLFGLNPMWVSTGVLLVTYAVIISEKINRSIIALLGAGPVSYTHLTLPTIYSV